MNPEKMLTIARKKNHCTIEVRGAAARVISIARRKRNAKDVPRRSHAPEDPTGDCLFIGRSQRGKPYALWRERLNINAPTRARYKVEALFAELKNQMKLRRVRLRRLWNVAEQFHLAATVQNLKRLVRHLAEKQSLRLGTS